MNNFSEIGIKIQEFLFMKNNFKCRLRDGDHLVQGKMS